MMVGRCEMSIELSLSDDRYLTSVKVSKTMKDVWKIERFLCTRGSRVSKNYFE
ncbi:Hypothetical protein [Corynebacterium glutamicum ATCC 13032]|uniref:Uncharacterized protein n=1 Tax=Corynebacterium glutamicum (strain ATCC 13032 / DSM 20300 / JCM 1318 / BCRC 11384 / CCUG 27702 / LMG 3730 / NBRC 12168 / NCIMB 10025 / NRRL B-2784 / 534) TaxID=196627 RepID=Q8NSV3_CORGL|nr:Hypothetical protein [Corynebacterium glutamicum ATCC 13032]